MTSFWLLSGCLDEPNMRQSRFQERVEKNIDFRDPFFSILPDFEGPGGSKSLRRSPLFRLFSDLWGYFFCSGAILGHFDGFYCFWNHFCMFFFEFLGIETCKRSCILWPRLQQKSTRFSQDSGRSRQDSDRFSAHLRVPGAP